MKTARLKFTADGKVCGWDSNYYQGGKDLVEIAEKVKEMKDQPFIRLGRIPEEQRDEQRHENALNYFLELNENQGFQTREQAETGKRVKPKPVMKEYRKAIGQRLYEWFTEVVE